VKKMIDVHNGEVFVKSKKGKGSTFFIKLPLEKDE
jgi:two-component system phosphate regulon sensor histidine kinase PhoR